MAEEKRKNSTTSNVLNFERIWKLELRRQDSYGDYLTRMQVDSDEEGKIGIVKKIAFVLVGLAIIAISVLIAIKIYYVIFTENNANSSVKSPLGPAACSYNLTLLQSKGSSMKNVLGNIHITFADNMVNINWYMIICFKIERRIIYYHYNI